MYLKMYLGTVHLLSYLRQLKQKLRDTYSSHKKDQNNHTKCLKEEQINYKETKNDLKKSKNNMSKKLLSIILE